MNNPLTISKIIELSNEALTCKIKSLKPVKRIPKTAMFGFNCSAGFGVCFTEKCTYVNSDIGIFKAILK